jgi:hypothetical protein
MAIAPEQGAIVTHEPVLRLHVTQARGRHLDAGSRHGSAHLNK